MTPPDGSIGRIGFVGDWHGNRPWATSVLTRLRQAGVDVAVHVGDFGPTPYEGSDFDRYLDAIDQAGVPVLFVDGNHDDHPALHAWPVGPGGLHQLSELVWHMPRGHRWEWGGVRFLACGGAYSVDRDQRILGESWWWEETVTDADIRACTLGGPADVLISHDTPAGYPIPGVDDTHRPPGWPHHALVQAAEHRRRLREITTATRPARIFHGHYHRRYHRGVDLGYGPVIIDGLDCDGTTLDGNTHIIDVSALKRSVRNSP